MVLSSALDAVSISLGSPRLVNDIVAREQGGSSSPFMHSRLGRQRCEQFIDGFSGSGMMGFWCDVSEWDKDEAALVHPRVGYVEFGR